MFVCLNTSFNISGSGILFIDRPATILLTSLRSEAVYLDTLLCRHFVEIKNGLESRRKNGRRDYLLYLVMDLVPGVHIQLLVAEDVAMIIIRTPNLQSLPPGNLATDSATNLLNPPPPRLHQNYKRRKRVRGVSFSVEFM